MLKRTKLWPNSCQIDITAPAGVCSNSPFDLYLQMTKLNTHEPGWHVTRPHTHRTHAGNDTHAHIDGYVTVWQTYAKIGVTHPVG